VRSEMSWKKSLSPVRIRVVARIYDDYVKMFVAIKITKRKAVTTGACCKLNRHPGFEGSWTITKQDGKTLLLVAGRNNVSLAIFIDIDELE